MKQTTPADASRAQRLRRAIACGAVLLAALATQSRSRAERSEPVLYPEEYRTWFHVKTALVSSQHPDFARSGGFRHIYANPQAVVGYRTGQFPEGSIIVVDWVEGREEKGMFTEAARRRLDVMVKDGPRFQSTGGWGWERFNGNSRTERMVTSPAKQCFECHSGSGARDSVFSKLRE